jgi:MurNAc alpha-1-phosphate uridylyltransferase
MNWRPQSAMVLAAGFGQRMRPLTQDAPKPLVRLNGRALIDHVLDRIGDAGVPRAIVNVHYRADQIEAHVALRSRPAITISDERLLLLDTGGGVRKALPLLDGPAFLVHNSDSVWIDSAGSNLERLFSAWDERRMDCLLLLAPLETSLGYVGNGDFSLSPASEIVRRVPGVRAPLVFAGVSIAHRRMFEACPDGPFSLNVLWDRAIAAGRAFGVTLQGTWMHVGDPAAHEQAERLLGRGVHA